MSNELRGYTVTFTGTTDLVTETCCNCGVLFAMTADYERRRRAKKDSFYCPNGHGQHYTGPTDTDRLREAKARETALRDQLEASIRDAEAARAALMRDRQRFINGVCPCCNRSFENVRRHMASKHPDYDAAAIAQPLKFKCGCGRKFDSYHGLRIHQGRSRSDDWAKPGASRWSSHLTEGATR